jgi:hypothetical protein
MQMLEACGKVQKWSRPVDANQKPKQFGFCTFEFGRCALRCKNVLSAFDLSDYCSDSTEPLQIKAGTKEQAALDSMIQVSCHALLFIHVKKMRSYKYHMTFQKSLS